MPRESSTALVFGEASGRVHSSQYSLRSLFLFMTGCCLGAALLPGLISWVWLSSTSRRSGEGIQQALPPLPRVVVALPDDQPGPFPIDDAELIYVSSMAGCNELTWRFRVHLPPGKRWLWGVNVGEQWLNQTREFDGCTCAGAFEVSGDVVIDAGIVRNADGVAYLQMQCGPYSCGASLEEPAVAVIQSNGKVTQMVAGQDGPQSFPAGGHIELLRFHRLTGNNARAPAKQPLYGRRKPLLSYGFSLYIEEQGWNR